MTSPYRWTILAVGVGAQAAISALRLGLPSLGPALRSAYGLSLPALGVAFASVSAGIVLTLLAWGALADRVGERPVLAVGLTGAAAALVAGAFAPSYGWLLVALVVAGMAGSSATGASGRAVMGWFGRRERGMALGVRQMGVPVGGGVAALTLPALAGAGGLRAALLALAGGCVLGAGASALWMREAPEPDPPPPASLAPPPTRDGRLWRLAAASGLLVCAQAGILGFVVVYLHEQRGWSPTAAAGALAVLNVGGAVVRVAAGRWSDRLQLRVAPMARLGLAAAVLLIAAAALSPAPSAVLVPVLLAAGVLAMSWNGLSFTAAAEMSGRRRAGTAIGVQNTVLSAAGVVAPVAVGALVAAVSWPAAWLALAASQLVGVRVLGPLVPEEEERRAARAARQRGADQRPACHPSPPRVARTSRPVLEEVP